jgi:hypothetical protein
VQLDKLVIIRGKRKTVLTSAILLKNLLQGVQAPILIATIIAWHHYMIEVVYDAGDSLRSVYRHRIGFVQNCYK